MNQDAFQLNEDNKHVLSTVLEKEIQIKYKHYLEEIIILLMTTIVVIRVMKTGRSQKISGKSQDW